MTNKVSHVDAVFGGKKVRFELPRAAGLDATVAELTGSPAARPFDVFRSLAAGTWSAKDLLAVLRHAHPDCRMGRMLGEVNVAGPPIARHGMGTYAPLAAKIMEAHLFGLDPDKATFNEATALTEAA